MALIGLDIGTTGCKAHVFSEDLNLLASASREYAVDIPHPQWAEQDAEKVWILAKECLRESVAKARCCRFGQGNQPVCSGRGGCPCGCIRKSPASDDPWYGYPHR